MGLDRLEKVSKVEFRNFKREGAFRLWGRRRIALLIVGYLLICGVHRIERKAMKWLIEEPKKLRHPIPRIPFLAACFVYDHVRFVDTKFRYSESDERFKNFFRDPLVFYRCAYLAVRRGEYRRAISILREPVENNYFSPFYEINKVDDSDYEASTENLRILNPARFVRRTAEYNYAHFIRSSQSDYDSLADAINTLKKIVFDDESSTCGPWAPTENLILFERVKAACLLIEILFIKSEILAEVSGEVSAEIKRVEERIGSIWRQVIEEELSAKSLKIPDLTRFVKGSPSAAAARGIVAYIDGDLTGAQRCFEDVEKKMSERVWSHRMLQERYDAIILIKKYLDTRP